MDVSYAVEPTWHFARTNCQARDSSPDPCQDELAGKTCSAARPACVRRSDTTKGQVSVERPRDGVNVPYKYQLRQTNSDVFMRYDDGRSQVRYG